MTVALAMIVFNKTLNNLKNFWDKGDYIKARDYLQSIMLLIDFVNRVEPIMHNADPKKWDEILKLVEGLVSLGF